MIQNAKRKAQKLLLNFDIGLEANL